MSEHFVKPGRKKGIENFHLDDRGVNQVLLARVALIGSSLATVIVLGAFVTLPISIVPERTSAPVDDLESRHHGQLVRLLTRLHGEWDPRVRARVLDEAPDSGALLGTLDRFLRIGDSPLLASAIEFAAATRRPELRPAIITLLGHEHPKVRHAAMIAADRLTPFAAKELEAYILSPHADLVLAALELCAGRADRPLDVILDRAFDANPKLAGVARAALPDVLPARLLATIRDRLENASPGTDDVRMALEVLAALDPARLDTTTIDAIARCARLASDECRTCAIPMLAARKETSPCSEALWALVEDQGMSASIRRRALHGLEGSPAAAISRLEGIALFMDDRDRIFVARCMLGCGQREAARNALCAQLAVGEGDPVARAEAQRLLGWLTGLGPSASRDAFERAPLGGAQRPVAAVPPPSEALFDS